MDRCSLRSKIAIHKKANHIFEAFSRMAMQGRIVGAGESMSAAK